MATPATTNKHTITRAACRGHGVARLLTRAAALLGCWAVATLGASAEPVRWLYDVQVPVASQTEDERQRATRLALTEVLARLTGTAPPLTPDEIAVALAAPARYVLRYQFASAERPETGNAAATKNPDNEARQTGLLLDVRFDPEAVLTLLRDAKQPIWGANRPTVLVWLAVRGDGRDDLVASGPAAALDRRARQRGVATAWPLLDLRDREVGTATIWGFFWEAIEAASRRYRPDLLLVGRAALGQGGWWTDWELREPARFDSAAFQAGQAGHAGRAGHATQDTSDARGPLNARFRHQAATLEQAARAVIDDVADTLAARFAVHGGYTRNFQATVHGVRTVRDYASLFDHLNAQEYIDRVDMLAAAPRALDIRLLTRSDVAQLAQLLAQDERLAVRRDSGRLDITWRPRQ